jgi:hypothetical protein
MKPDTRQIFEACIAIRDAKGLLFQAERLIAYSHNAPNAVEVKTALTCLRDGQACLEVQAAKIREAFLAIADRHMEEEECKSK